MKRASSGSINDGPGPSKRPDLVTIEDDEVQEAPQPPLTPILQQGKIYYTPIGGISVPVQESLKVDTLSFNEIISLIRPVRSIHFVFMIDFDFFINSFPESLRSQPITIAIGRPDCPELEKECAAYPNITVVPVVLGISFGCHHTKMMILEDEQRKVHFVLTTANMIPGDWEFKTQQIYYAFGEKKGDLESVKKSPFQADLIEYVALYKHPVQEWRDLIEHTDFSSVSDRLIFSTPGYHDESRLDRYGHRRLSRILGERFPVDPGYIQEDRYTFVTQCSSIGSLGKTPGEWFRGEFTRSLHAGIPPANGLSSKVYLIYPCEEDVRTSCQGYGAAGSFPYKRSVHLRQPWLKSSMCKWRSKTRDRTQAAPHCKSYVKFDKRVPQWQLVTSANVSKAAWGMEKPYRNRTQLFIRSWEMGVLITDPSRFNIPFDYPLVPYGDADEPFFSDVKHLKPDAFNQIIEL
uniref:Tyrosyl-DNA phosphodiesterase 1 n=1 Tax=Caenorhabditis tropicalis TaxID=1561998 RepID=A0A1I7TQE0_9PELO